MAGVLTQGNTQFDNEYEEELVQYLRANFKEELMKILADKEPSKHYAVTLNLVEMNCDCPSTVTKLFNAPEVILPIGQISLRKALQIEASSTSSNDDSESLSLKTNVHLRFTGMPEEGLGLYFKTFPRQEMKGKFISLEATVVKTWQRGCKQYKQDYKCSVCQSFTTYYAPESRYGVTFPKTLNQSCSNGCRKSKLILYDYQSPSASSNPSLLRNAVRDYQEIKIQELLENSGSSCITMPNVMIAVLSDDLVDSCIVGDDVILTGYLMFRFKDFRRDQPIEARLDFIVNHVEQTHELRTSSTLDTTMVKFFDSFWHYYQDDPYYGRNIIIRSFASHITGNYITKLSLCVVLAGGVAKDDGSGCKTRGNSHLLIVGCPGVAKSRFLKYAAAIIPYGIYTSGAGTTGPGLTAAAIKEPNVGWVLEAGSLVLANNSVCCIDEFMTINEASRQQIHEAMEQQTLSFAKAGLVTSLQTRCSVIAAMNPLTAKSLCNTEGVDTEFGIESPLLSRFDLVVSLDDSTVNKEWEEQIADFILRDATLHVTSDASATTNTSSNRTGKEKTEEEWNIHTIKTYFRAIRGLEPEMTTEATAILVEYFHLQRLSSRRNAARTTPRLLDSLFRLAEGHAKLMRNPKVRVHDAVVAVALVEINMKSSAIIFNQPNPLHVAYPDDPLMEYYNQAKTILALQNMPKNVWEKEEEHLKLMLKRREESSSIPDSKPTPPTSSYFSGASKTYTSNNRNVSVISNESTGIHSNVPLQFVQASATASSSSLNDHAEIVPTTFFDHDNERFS